MTEPHLLTQARTALRDLTRLAAERARAEQEVASRYAEAVAAARKDHEEARQRTLARYAVVREAGSRGTEGAPRRRAPRPAARGRA